VRGLLPGQQLVQMPDGKLQIFTNNLTAKVASSPQQVLLSVLLFIYACLIHDLLLIGLTLWNTGATETFSVKISYVFDLAKFYSLGRYRYRTDLQIHNIDSKAR
jgi:hypothetical protein